MSSPLTTYAQIVCPHGGTVNNTTSSLERDGGGRPLLNASDSLSIAGCPMTPSACVQLQWLPQSGESQVTQDTPSSCLTADGTPQGQAVIMSE
jgi:hypothetical protein